MYVGGLEVEEVEEGGVVHGGHGPGRDGSRGTRGEAVCEGGSGRMPGRSGGRGVGRMPATKGLGAGRRVGRGSVTNPLVAPGELRPARSGSKWRSAY